MIEITVRWAEVTERETVIQVPEDTTGKDRLEAATIAALVGTRDPARVLAGTVKWQAADGTFGGSL